MGKVLGIDLGTTNSVMAVMQGGEPTVITNVEGGRTTPSIVGISKSGERLVGQIAKRQAIINPENTIFSIKRLIGRSFEDDEVQRDLKLLPYQIVKSGNHTKVKMGDKEYSPEEVSAMILAKMKADAEAFLNEKITEAVITVPAYFNDSQRQATKDAGKIAGLEVKRIINEPTAAALAYGLDKKKEEKIAVFDLGGGTFDISILELGDGVFEVKSTNGDTHLGGDDFDQRVIDFLVEEFKKDQGVDLTNDKTALQRLKEAAEKAKIELSTTQETEINIPFITADQTGPKHLALKLSRAKLYELVKDLVDNVEGPVNQALKDAGLSAADINEVILVGGMTRMPEIQDKVKAIFGKEPMKGVNPDEVVAVGAAIQGGVLTGEVKDILLLDVTPLTLGIETLGGVSTPMIERNTTVPTSKTQTFSTADDNQPMVEVHVLQGERPMAGDNKSLGKFILDGIPPAPRGVPQIEVTFDIDANGILSVKAKDKASGKEQHITIEGSSSLNKDEVEKMQKEAELHAEEDKKKTEIVEAKNIGSTMLYTAEKTLKDAGDKLTDDERKPIQEKQDELKKALEGDSVENIKSATDALSSELQKVGTKLYEAAKDQPTENSGETPTDSSGNTKEAEVIEEAEQAAKEADESTDENKEDKE